MRKFWSKALKRVHNFITLTFNSHDGSPIVTEFFAEPRHSDIKVMATDDASVGNGFK